jgi:glycosyltransferase involved in cell wall biosynthesis
MPSFAEGLPVTIMESLAVGRPVVATAIAGVPELVSDGRQGWLVPPGSVDALAEAMRAALAAPVADLERMGLAGAALVAERHDGRRQAAQLAELFSASAAGHGR